MYLSLGVFLFISIHLLPSFSTTRKNIVDCFGRFSYILLFSSISIAGLTLIILGKIEAPRLEIWTPPFWTVLVPVAVMPLVFILIVSAYYKSNIQRIIRHPMLYGVLLWSFAHLLANGDLASIILFSGFATFCIVDLFSAYSRTRFDSPGIPNHIQPISFDGELVSVFSTQENDGRKPSSFSKLNPRRQLSIERFSIKRDITAITMGVVIYLFVLYFHSILFGITSYRP